MLLAIIAQQFLPAFTTLNNARIFLLLIVFLCSSITVPLPVMFLYALLGGFLWDAQCTLGSFEVDPYVYPDPVASLRFGTSMILFGLAGLFMHGFRPFFLQGKWYMFAGLTGVATLLFCLLEYVLIDFVRGSLTIHGAVFLQCLYTALFSMALSPLIFPMLFWFSKHFHHPVMKEPNEQNRYN